jgi:hypothetical protein
LSLTGLFFRDSGIYGALEALKESAALQGGFGGQRTWK